MYYSSRAKVITHGVPVPLTTDRVMASWVEIVADPSNTSWVYVGGPNTTRGGGPLSKTYEGIPIKPGVWLLMREMGGYAFYDLRYIMVDSETDGDSVDFVYGRS
jgi:hypothetical protein